MLGLLTMIVAAYVLVANLTDADLSFRLVGPPMIGAFGGMLLLVGLAGVVAGRAAPLTRRVPPAGGRARSAAPVRVAGHRPIGAAPWLGS